MSEKIPLVEIVPKLIVKGQVPIEELQKLVDEWRSYADIQAFMQANNTLKKCADQLEELIRQALKGE